MKFFSANLTTLPEVYIVQLAKALDMEESIADLLPKMISRAYDPQLRRALESHLKETENHAQWIKRLLRDQRSENCRTIQALVSETEDVMKDVTDVEVLDAALVAQAQQIEHHEIAVYGTLKAWARLLGRFDDHAVFEGIESNERATDALLRSIGDRVNSVAPAVAA